jgi:hypothetical protein
MRGGDGCRCQSTSVDKQQEPKAKRSLLDNASNLLTNVLSGRGLRNMPVAEGTFTDLFGKPLFFSLYDWFLEVRFPPPHTIISAFQSHTTHCGLGPFSLNDTGNLTENYVEISDSTDTL